jgi:DNA-binding transcriptional regulator GbsR (MarR family)
MIIPLREKKNEEFERALDGFIEAAGKISANMLGMVNRVGGQIYALLFLSREPLSLDDIAEILKISKSNISINIRLLEENKLVRKVWVKGSRRDFYEACRDYPKQFFKGFFDRLREGIDESIRIINKCRIQFDQVKKGMKENSQDVEFILNQLTLLDTFYRAASQFFDSFYQGRKVDIDLLRNVIFEE